MFSNSRSDIYAFVLPGLYVINPSLGPRKTVLPFLDPVLLYEPTGILFATVARFSIFLRAISIAS